MAELRGPTSRTRPVESRAKTCCSPCASAWTSDAIRHPPPVCPLDRGQLLRPDAGRHVEFHGVRREGGGYVGERFDDRQNAVGHVLEAVATLEVHHEPAAAHPL